MPKTMIELIDYLYSNLQIEEIDYLKEKGSIGLHHGYGTFIRNEYKLWDKHSDLHKFFVKEFGLNHADDMSGLILEGLVCKARGLKFDPTSKVEQYKRHWISMGIDPSNT